MRLEEKLIVQIEAEHWLLLTCNLEGEWAFEIWGRHPACGRIGLVCEESAKQHALSGADAHLKQYGLLSASSFASNPAWRVAVLRRVA